MLTANVVAVLVMLPLAALLAVPYLLIWHRQGLSFALDGFGWLPWLLVTLVGGIVVHELIHGIAWAVASGRSLRDIEFGVQWQSLTPYAHTKGPMPARAYRIGAAMPGLLLGVVPVILATATGNGSLLAFGLLFTWAAGGDWLILWLLRGLPGDALVEDHPTRAGCYVFEPTGVGSSSGRDHDA